MPVKKKTDGSRTRILIALATAAHRKQIKAMLPSKEYLLSWAADAKTAKQRLAKRPFDTIILDVSPWNNDKLVAGREILKAAGSLPAIVMPYGCDAAGMALNAFGVGPRLLPWDVMDERLLQAMVALVTVTYRDRQNLRESEQHFAKTFQASPGMFAITTPKDGIHVDVNDSWLSRLAYKRSEIIGRTVGDIGVWADYSDRARLVGALLKDGRVRNFETRFRTSRGEIIDVLVAGEVINIKEEAHLLTVSLDITERKRIEKALRKSHDELELNVYERTRQLHNEIEERKTTQAALELSEQRVRDMAEAASDWFWETDADGRYTYFSASHRKMFGVKSTDLIGKKRETLLIPDGDTDELRAHAKLIKERKPFRDFQYDHILSRGEPQTVKISGKPIFNEDGEFIGYRGAGTNITPQVTAERREAKMRGQLVDAVEGISDALILFDAEDKFVMCNSRHRQIFKEITDVFVPGVPARKILRAIVGNDYIVSARDDPRKWFRGRMVEVRDQDHSGSRRDELMRDGTWLRFNEYETSEGGRLLLLADVTKLRQTEEELRAAKNQAEVANRAKSDFLAGMSHELRTPLNAIIGFSDVMLSQTYGEIPQQKYREYLDDINRSGVLLLDLINDILDISKIESGAVELHVSRVNLAKLVETAIRLFENKSREGGVIVEKRIPKKLPLIVADERRVNQILLNLVSNAVKFTAKGGHVRISAAVRANGALALSVSDTGIGIAPDDLEKVMTEFGQVDNAVARENEGTGLGLPLTRGLMEVHGGKLEIVSKPGKGTRVTAVFPKKRVVAD